jgi:DNA-binding GntR family transcriptional regulator
MTTGVTQARLKPVRDRPYPQQRPKAEAPMGEWSAARPRTLVDHAVDAILSAASRGLIIPGERLSEPELCRRLRMSRVPIREALRTLESQGVVTSEPYKGIRLMTATRERLEQIIDVRVPLESLACRRAIESGRNGPQQIATLRDAVAEMDLMSQHGDTYGFATADTSFHRILCGFAGNPVLDMLWESIARQLTVIFGLLTKRKPMADNIQEHLLLVEIFASGDFAAMEHELEDHIRIPQQLADLDEIVSHCLATVRSDP